MMFLKVISFHHFNSHAMVRRYQIDGTPDQDPAIRKQAARFVLSYQHIVKSVNKIILGVLANQNTNLFGNESRY